MLTLLKGKFITLKKHPLNGILALRFLIVFCPAFDTFSKSGLLSDKWDLRSGRVLVLIQVGVAGLSPKLAALVSGSPACSVETSTRHSL